MSRKHKVTGSNNGRFTSIYINGLPHIKAISDEIVGLQSWKHAKDWYCLELYLSNKRIRAEYDNMALWAEVLKKLDELLN